MKMPGTNLEPSQQPHGDQKTGPPGIMAAPQQIMTPPRLKPGNRTIIGIIALAALVLMAGSIVIQVRPLFKTPNTIPDYDNWLNLMKYLRFIGLLLIDIGAFLLLLIGPYAAITREDLSERVRRSLIGMSASIAMAWIIMVVLGSAFIPAVP